MVIRTISFPFFSIVLTDTLKLEISFKITFGFSVRITSFNNTNIFEFSYSFQCFVFNKEDVLKVWNVLSEFCSCQFGEFRSV